MKKILALSALACILASCGQSEPTTGTGATATNSQSSTSEARTVKEGDEITVDYIGKFPDGKVFDTSISDEAKKAGLFNAARTYEPLALTAKQSGGTIDGFWKATIGMKVGEKKTVTLEPKDAYGEAWISEGGDRQVDKKLFAATFESKVPVSETKDSINMQVPRKVLENQGPLPKIGDVLHDSQGRSAKVVAIDDTNISVTIDNSTGPFHGKKLVAGTELTYEGNPAKITAVDKDNVTLLVTNKNNPFAGKTLAVGLEGLYQETQKLKIVKIEGDNITIAISQKNPSELAGKTLVFDLELKSIK